MWITYHAQQRFSLWVDALAPPVTSLLRMWYTGREATDDDFHIFGAARKPGHTYRVCQHGMMVVMLVEVDGYIKTVLDQRKMRFER